MENQVSKRDRFYKTGFGGVVYVLLIGIIAFAMTIVGQLIGIIPEGFLRGLAVAAYNAGNELWGDIWTTAALYGMTIGEWVAFLMLVLIPKRNRYLIKQMYPGKGNTVFMLLFGLLLGFLMNFSCAAAAMLHNDIKLSFAGFNIIPFLMLLLLVFVQSSAEEAFCRCYMYQKYLARYPQKWVAAILNAAVFAALHLMNPGLTVYSMLNIFLSGIVFSLMVMYMDSIWCAMACHCGWNFTQNILLGLPNSGIVVPYSIFRLDAATARDSFAYSTSFGIEGALMAAIVQIVVIVGIVWYYERKKKAA